MMMIKNNGINFPANRFLNLAGTLSSTVFQDPAGFVRVSSDDHENSYLNSSQRLDDIFVTTYPRQNLGIADDNDAVPELKRNFQLATSHREHSRSLSQVFLARNNPQQTILLGSRQSYVQTSWVVQKTNAL